MALSFTLAQPSLPAAPPAAGRRTVLVTGAAGNIGAYFAERATRRYDLSLMVHEATHGEKIKPFGRVVVADLADLDGLTRLLAGKTGGPKIDTVLHLAAAASPDSTWDQLLSANIVGTYHVMVAAKAAGCRRVIYASSIHAVSGYPKDVQVKTTDPVNPGDLYGVSKCFGEALSRYMASQEGLSVIALRIGGFQPTEEAKKETGIAMLDAFISQDDMQQILEKCIDDTALQFGLFNALSGNRFLRLDISDTRELLGYRPADDTTELHPALEPLDLDEKVVAHNKSDPAGGYPSGLRDELADAAAAAGKAPPAAKPTDKAGPKPPKRPTTKESPMSAKPGKTPKAQADKKPTGDRTAAVNPSDFGKSTSPVRERMAKAIKDTPPDERLKRGR
jgi:NAD(P)-dependent dehydrogenase (short-subunit alcohol dehydrogenase family)